MESRATKRDITVILFRCLSIYSFVKAIEFFSGKFSYFFNRENYSIAIFVQLIGPSVLLLICGVIIWYLAPVIATKVSKAVGQDDTYGFSLKDVHDIAFSAIGLFIIVITIPDFVQAIGFYYTIAFLSVGEKTLAYATQTSYLISLIIKFLLGIWLLIGSHRIVNIVRAMRRDEEKEDVEKEQRESMGREHK